MTGTGVFAPPLSRSAGHRPFGSRRPWRDPYFTLIRFRVLTFAAEAARAQRGATSTKLPKRRLRKVSTQSKGQSPWVSSTCSVVLAKERALRASWAPGSALFARHSLMRPRSEGVTSGRTFAGDIRRWNRPSQPLFLFRCRYWGIAVSDRQRICILFLGGQVHCPLPWRGAGGLS